MALTLSFAVGAAMRREVDIDVYLMGAARVLGSHLYAVALPGTGLKFTYPPFAALVFEPLRVMPQRGAQVVWACLNVAALGGLLFVSMRAVRPRLEITTVVRWAMILSAPAALLDPVFQTISLGQLNLFVVLLVLADLSGTRGVGVRRIPQGVLIGVAAALKLTPLVFVPYLFVTRQTRAAWTAVATFTGCSVVAMVIAPRSSWTFWTRDVFRSRSGPPWFISDQNVRGFVIRLLHGPAPAVLLWSVVIGCGAIGIGVAAVAYRQSSPLLGTLVCATTGLIVSPITWAHHLVWVVPLLFWLVLASDRPIRGMPIAVLVAALFWSRAIWWTPHGHNHELAETGWQVVVGSSYFLALCVFVAGTAALLTTRHLRTIPEAGRLFPLESSSSERRHPQRPRGVIGRSPMRVGSHHKRRQLTQS